MSWTSAVRREDSPGSRFYYSKSKMGIADPPLLIPGAPLDLVPEYPSNADLLNKLSSVLKSAVLPESKRIGESLFIQWEALDSEGAGVSIQYTTQKNQVFVKYRF